MSERTRRAQTVLRIVLVGFAFAIGAVFKEASLGWRSRIAMIMVTALYVGFNEFLFSGLTPPEYTWNLRQGVAASLAAVPAVGIGFVLTSILTWYQWIALIIAVGAIIAMTEGMRRKADRRADEKAETSRQADNSL
jgi:hypothetical protein